MDRPVALVMLGPGARATAERLRAALPQARLHGLSPRVPAEVPFTSLGEHLRALYRAGTPILAFCAAGIVIRALAPVLGEHGKTLEPPVLALAEDGSAVVPLLGGLGGVNALARQLAQHLGIAAAITTSGELRFGACLLQPPAGYALADLEQGKHFVSDLLAGAPARIEGAAPWLDGLDLPRDAQATHAIRITRDAVPPKRDELLIHPRVAIVALRPGKDDSAELVARVEGLLARCGIASGALAALLALSQDMASPALDEAARALGVALRFARPPGRGAAPLRALFSAALDPLETAPAILGVEPGDCGEAQLEQEAGDEAAVLAAMPHPLDPARLGQARGRLSVVGLGPGDAQWLTPAARAALDAAQEVLGYGTYVELAGPFRADQRVHASDNREELARARHAFALAAEGRRVVLVSSGDPGVFAMAAAVFEVLENAEDPDWAGVALDIVPGISAAFATAALAGAPLGHDFCVMSLSDNLKPWSVIEARLRSAAQGDFVLALYNPISRARPWQLDRALDLVRESRAAHTRVVLGRNIGRPGAALRTGTLGDLHSKQVDARTTLIIGSSTTHGVPRADGGEWLYTPRYYP